MKLQLAHERGAKSFFCAWVVVSAIGLLALGFFTD